MVVYVYGVFTREELAVRHRLYRVAGCALPVTAGLFFFFALTGVGGLSGGWLWASAIAALVGGAVGWLGFGAHGGRTTVGAVMAVGGLAFGFWMSQDSVLSFGRLRAEMNSISIPSSFDEVGDERVGVALCFDECTSLRRTWVAAASVEDVHATLTDVLREEGFVLEPSRSYRASHGVVGLQGHRGRLGIAVWIDPNRTVRDGQYVPLPAGRVEVSVTLDTYGGS
jgi:hypothetical protein